MISGHLTTTSAYTRRLLTAAIYLLMPFFYLYGERPMICDIDMAKDFCMANSLDVVEGIWIYPDDNVTVLVCRGDSPGIASLPEYDIVALESPDCRISPGETIGKIRRETGKGTYTVSIFTEKKNGLLSKPRDCQAKLSADGESLAMKSPKGGLRLRLNLNPSVLLPKLWRSIIRIGASTSHDATSDNKSGTGMLKIYPSYDGNGSSRREPRYL